MALSVKDLKAKLDENELDLSVQGLSSVPVKELAQIKRATKLDLSCNKLDGLPSDFVLLTHLVELDLSQNAIFALPDEFGRLSGLQKLDLYKNQLEELPVSFNQLKRLRWLDLKDNPLNPVLARVAGDCADARQCAAAASRMVKHMGEVASGLERERQKRLAQERAAAAKAAAADAKAMKEKAAAKKQERENRKHKAAKPPVSPTDSHQPQRNGKEQSGKRRAEPMKKRGVCGSFFAFVFGVLRLAIWSAVCVGFVVLAAAAILMLNCSYKPNPLVRNSNGLCKDVEKWVATGKPPANADSLHLAAAGLRAEGADFAAWVSSRDYGELATEAWAGTKARANRASAWLQTESGPWLKRQQANAAYFAAHAGDYAKTASRWTLARLMEAGEASKYYGDIAYKQGQVYYAKAAKTIASYSS